VPRLAAAGAAGYLLGDALLDSNPLHEACSACGIQAVAPRKKPGTGLGHGKGGHSARRLRSIRLTESPAPGDLPSPAAPPSPATCTRCAPDIETPPLGNLCCFGGGLAPCRRGSEPRTASPGGWREARHQRPAPVPTTRTYAVNRKSCGVPGEGERGAAVAFTMAVSSRDAKWGASSFRDERNALRFASHISGFGCGAGTDLVQQQLSENHRRGLCVVPGGLAFVRLQADVRATIEQDPDHLQAGSVSPRPSGGAAGGLGVVR
jgi:hypothetical protein